MQILAETEYQDLYRIKNGVLLIVNKFEPINYGGEYIYLPTKNKVKTYNKGCQKQLQVLIEDCYYKYRDIAIPKGTVLYNDRPVKLTGKSKWKYQIKTTSDLFSGDYDTILNLLNETVNVIKKDKE